MKFDKIIIVSDMDGTFLDDEAKTVQRNIAAIKYFISHGGMFTFATGRCYKEVNLAVPECNVICNAPSILANGSYLYNYQNHQKTAVKYLDSSIVDIVDRVLLDYPQIAIRAAYGDTYITPAMSTQNVEELKKFVVDIEELDFHKIDPNKFYKCVFCGDPSVLKKIRMFLEKNYENMFSYCSSCDEFFEILPLGATKGDRLADIKVAVNKPDAKLYAMGDFENDISMLKTADCAVVPANGLEILKRIPGCIQVCSNNDGAIADLIEILDKTYI